MTHLSDQKEWYRQFLLGNLPEQETHALEERMFLEPDFAEELQIEEEELIADYHSGALSVAERGQFEKKYHSTEINKQLLEYEATLTEFIGSKPLGKQSLGVETNPIVPVETEPFEPINKPGLVDFSWFRSHFTFQRTLAYSTAAVGVIVIGLAVWYFFLSNNYRGHSAQRKAIEAALAALNTPEKIAGIGFGAAAEVKPIQRFGGETVRIGEQNVSADGLIPFRLNLTEGKASAYNATFLDERRNELFTIPNIPVRSTLSGPQLWMVVPVKYLSRGDYQIELKDATSETSTPGNSYPFRMVR